MLNGRVFSIVLLALSLVECQDTSSSTSAALDDTSPTAFTTDTITATVLIFNVTENGDTTSTFTTLPASWNTTQDSPANISTTGRPHGNRSEVVENENGTTTVASVLPTTVRQVAPTPMSPEKLQQMMAMLAAANAMKDKNLTREEQKEALHAAWNKTKEKLKQGFSAHLEGTEERTLIALMFIYGCGFLIGFTGNLCTLFATLRYRIFSGVTNIFLAALASADLAVVALCFPLKGYEYLAAPYWHLGGAACKILHYAHDVAMACSALIQTAISFERFYAVCYPTKAVSNCSIARARTVCVVLWMVSLGLGLPTALIFDSIPPSSEGMPYLCAIKKLDKLYVQLFWTYRFICIFILPVFIMIYTYGRATVTLLMSAFKSRQLRGATNQAQVRARQLVATTQASSSGSSPTTNDKSKLVVKEKRKRSEFSRRLAVIRMLLLVLFVFIICWGPALAFRCINVFSEEFGVGLIRHFLEIELITITASYIASAINPLIYCFSSKKFIMRFLLLISCGGNRERRKRKQAGVVSASGTHSSAVPTTSSGSTILHVKKPKE